MLLALTLAALFPWLGAWGRRPPSWSLYMPAMSTALLLLLAMSRTLRPRELALVFVLQLAVCGVAGSGLVDTWFRVLFTKPIYAGDPALAALGEAYPAALSVDPASATAAQLTAGMLRGNNPLGELPPLLGALWAPVLAGTAIMLGGLAMVLGLLAATHRQWSVHERLQHPLAEVSGGLCDGTWRSAPFLGAVAAALLPWLWNLSVLGGWNLLPKLELAIPLTGLAPLLGVEQPASPDAVTQWQTLTIQPFAIGLAFLLVPVIAASLWSTFFVAVLVFGWLTAAGFDANFETDGRGVGGGAMVAFAAIVVWAGRHHFLALLWGAIGRGHADGDRLGVWGVRAALLASLGVGVALSWIGGHWAAGVIGVLLVWIFLIVLARVVAESGMIAFQTAQDVVPFAYACGLPAFLPLQAMFAALWLGQTLCGDTRTSLAGLGAHATGLGERQGLGAHRALLWMAALLPVILLLALGSRLWSAWDMPGQIPSDLAWRASELKAHLARIDAGGWALQPLPLLIGAALVAAVALSRRLWSFTPLHPIGLVCAFSRPVSLVWFALCLGWAAKVCVLRWGGMALYQRLRPVAMGLIVGDCCGMAARHLATVSGVPL